MKIPVFLVSAAVLFWGWQTGLWFFAGAIALILAASRWVPYRWDFSANDFRRIANLCLMILCGLLVYFLLVNRSIDFIYKLVQWLPAVLFPLLAAQAYSVGESLDIRTLFLAFNQGIGNGEDRPFLVNLNPPYFLLCLVAASTGNKPDISFYVGMFVLTALAFWLARYKRFSPLVWLCLILLAGGAGFIGQVGLHQLHLTVEQQVAGWFSNTSEQETDLLQKQTQIGEIGVLKQSNKIIFRVATENRQAPPQLLREATYNKFLSGNWIAVKTNFNPVPANGRGTDWYLGEKPATSARITISAALPGGHGLLRLPDGTFQIDDLPVSQMERNQYGTVKVSGKVDAIAYKPYFNPNLSLDSPPTPDDLQIPNAEKAALNRILSQLNVQNQSPAKLLLLVDGFFQKNFTYSLTLTGKGNSSTPLSKFLLQTRSGHCEYFATATALLLRSLGIPARYAVGYSVREFSPLENQYVVRSRHAHAWTLAYIEGKWQAFDTTPADWASREDAAASQWAWIGDLGSLLSFKIFGWLRHLSGSHALKYSTWLLFPFVGFLMWKLSRKKRVRPLRAKQNLSNGAIKSESTPVNSEFDLIEQAFNELGWFRHPSESLKTWIERLKEEHPELPLLEELKAPIALHYRDRFDPQGILDEERARLKSSLQSWLEKYRQLAKN